MDTGKCKKGATRDKECTDTLPTEVSNDLKARTSFVTSTFAEPLAPAMYSGSDALTDVSCFSRGKMCIKIPISGVQYVDKTTATLGTADSNIPTIHLLRNFVETAVRSTHSVFCPLIAICSWRNIIVQSKSR